MKKFDLNIGQGMANLPLHHAVKELIANALEEQRISGGKDPEIYCDGDGNWHIHDFGRGMKSTHLSFNENDEKLPFAYSKGQYGVGLKNAISAFDRYGVTMTIDSKYCHISFERTDKHGFEGVTTILALIEDPRDENFTGTDITLKGVTEKDVENAKSMFIKYLDLEPLEVTKFGAVYPRAEKCATIFVNGVRIATEQYFLFTYDLTSNIPTVSRSLDRGRLSVGPNAYRERIKAILTNCVSDAVIDALTADLDTYGEGTMCDELRWPKVAAYAAMKLNSRRNVLFLTPRQLEKNIRRVGMLKWELGKDLVFINSQVLGKIEGQTDDNGNVISTLNAVE
ncbi:MAG: hypothetical protein IJ072_01205 [Oscillospiraceae bacterium]|nr:hypothetical protein [Oscillospiraceae bacterium]